MHFLRISVYVIVLLYPIIVRGVFNDGTDFHQQTFDHGNRSAHQISKMKATFTTSTLPDYSRLPEDDNSFKTIRNSGKIFVDKSQYLEHFLNRTRKFYFLTRPRRFGKTLFAEMIVHFFRGEKQLFDGLAIFERGNSDKVGEWLEYPVIHLNFGGMTRMETAKEFTELLNQNLEKAAKKYGVTCEKPFNFSLMIENLKEKCQNRSVIIVIDEYDSPVNHALYGGGNRFLAKSILEEMKGFFNKIKASEEHLRLVYVTGVNKLAFSDLDSGGNNFEDISLCDEFAGVTGFFPFELKKFTPYLSHFASHNNLTNEQAIETLNYWYNGYSFSKAVDQKVLNPISIIHCLRQKRTGNYWSRTGTISRLIIRFKNQHIPWNFFKNFWTTRRSVVFSSFDILEDDIPLLATLFLNGYVTIKQYSESEYDDKILLDYPNNEIRSDLMEQLDQKHSDN